MCADRSRGNGKMSCNRENVIWKRPDGTFGRGFYRVVQPDRRPEGWDYEWDVTYDYSEFFWAEVGMRSMEQAQRAWKGANPGYPDYVEYEKDPVAVAQFECMARSCLHAAGGRG
jgi:hypothetical protein